MSYKEKIAKRAAAEIQAGQIINLGIGIPTLIPKYLGGNKQTIVHSENGILGLGLPCKRGAEDRNLIDAGGTYVTIETGASFSDSALSFTLVRGGRLDIAVLSGRWRYLPPETWPIGSYRESILRELAAGWNWPRKPGA